MSRSSKYQVKDSVGFWLTLSARSVEGVFEEVLKEYEITRLGYCIMSAIENCDLDNPSQIADYLQIERSTISRTLKKLEARNLVERTPEEADRRFICLGLTESGKRILPQLISGSKKANKELKRTLSKQEITQLEKILKKISSSGIRSPKSL